MNEWTLEQCFCSPLSLGKGACTGHTQGWEWVRTKQTYVNIGISINY